MKPYLSFIVRCELAFRNKLISFHNSAFHSGVFNNRATRKSFSNKFSDEQGDVPGWVLVVLMTTGLVTAIWTIAAPRLTAILRNSLDAMNGVR